LNDPSDVYVSGKYAYIAASSDDSLTIVDVSDPTNPTFVGNVSGSGSPTYLSFPWGLQVYGNYAYTATAGDSALVVIDVSDPTSPSVVGTVRDSSINEPYGLSVQGRYAYVVSATGDSLTIIDLGGLDTPTLNAGDVKTSSVEVDDNVDIGNDLYVRGGGVFGGKYCRSI
jgi:hypothetical protein